MAAKVMNAKQATQAWPDPPYISMRSPHAPGHTHPTYTTSEPCKQHSSPFSAAKAAGFLFFP